MSCACQRDNKLRFDDGDDDDDDDDVTLSCTS